MSAPILWLVTASDQFYPEEGTDDWEVLTPDVRVAFARLAALKEGDADRASLVAVCADGTYFVVAERWPRDHEPTRLMPDAARYGIDAEILRRIVPAPEGHEQA